MSKSSSSIWHYVVIVNSTVKIFSIFVAFLEKTNFNRSCFHQPIIFWLFNDNECFLWQFFVSFYPLTKTCLSRLKQATSLVEKKIGIGENEIYLMSLINVKITWEIFSNFVAFSHNDWTLISSVILIKLSKYKRMYLVDMYLWIWVCCFNPDEVANVFPHSGQAWLLAPTWLVRMCLCKLLGSVKTLSQFSQGNRRNSPWIILCLSKFGLKK